MTDRLTKRLGVLVLTGATLAASCGGRLTSFDLPDGGRVKFTRGALCDKVDLSTFNHNFLNPPWCKQEFVGEYPNEYPDPNPPCCAECDEWAKGFGVPFTLSVFCGKNTRETSCRISAIIPMRLGSCSSCGGSPQVVRFPGRPAGQVHACGEVWQVPTKGREMGARVPRKCTLSEVFLAVHPEC